MCDFAIFFAGKTDFLQRLKMSQLSSKFVGGVRRRFEGAQRQASKALIGYKATHIYVRADWITIAQSQRPMIKEKT